MDIKEYNKVKDMTYIQYCGYLQFKYGIGLSDYMTKSFNKNPKVTRTKEGLFAHHKMEDRVVMLSTKEIARAFPLEWQSKENIIYCDYLEHLLLHVLICKYPSPNRLPTMDVGYGGVVNFISPELNDLYSGFEPKVEWANNCFNRVKDDKDVYLLILKQFSDIMKEQNRFNIKELQKSSNKEYGTWSDKKNKTIYKEIKKNCK